MKTTFIPEEKAGTILCQRVASIPSLERKRERAITMASCMKFLQLSGLSEGKVTFLSYGCDPKGERGLLVSYQPPERVAGSKDFDPATHQEEPLRG